MPYFTATAPPNVSAPSFFRDRGNTTDVPTSPSDISVSGVPPMISLYSQLFATNVCGFGLSSVDEMDLEVKAYYDTSAVKPHPHFFPNSPLVGLTFNDNQSQRVSELATRFGLSREVVSRRTFYKGHVSQEAALTLLANGAEADSYLPYGVASLGGLLTFYSLRRVLYVALKAFPMSQRATALAEEIKLPEDPTSGGITIVHAERPEPVMSCQGFTAASAGHHCPYFPGMQLPDKNFLPSTLQLLGLSRLLAPSYDGVVNALSALRRGWRSLCYTPQGMELSHFVQVLSVALTASARPIYLISSQGAYAGAVVHSAGDILVGSRRHEAQVAASLQEAIRTSDQHDQGLSEIVQVLNLLKDDEDPSFTPQMLSTPRRLNQAFRQFKIDNADRKTLQQALAKLEFPQTYWDPKDKGKLGVVIDLILNDSEPSIDSPMPYKSDVIFSSNRIQTTLAGYGDHAPTFSLISGNLSISMKKSFKNKDGRLQNSSFKDAGVTHVPIYVLPLQQAATTWATFKAHNILHITTRAGRPTGSRMSIPQGGEEGQALLLQLARFAKHVNVGKRRAAESDDEEDAAETIKRLSKKLKMSEATAAQFAALAGIAGPSTTGAELNLGEDMDE